MSIKCIWVKAHQDDHIAFEDLDLIAQLNVRVYCISKWTLKGGIADQVFIGSDFPFEEIRIKIGTKKVTKALKSPKAALNSYWSTTMTTRDLYHNTEIAQRDAFDLICDLVRRGGSCFAWISKDTSSLVD